MLPSQPCIQIHDTDLSPNSNQKESSIDESVASDDSVFLDRSEERAVEKKSVFITLLALFNDTIV